MVSRLVTHKFLIIWILIAALKSGLAAESYGKPDSLRALLRSTSGRVHISTLNSFSDHIRIDSPEVAFQYALRALVLSRMGKYHDEEAFSWKNLAMVYVVKNKYEQAAEYFKVALNIAQKHHDKVTSKSVYQSLGRMEMRRKNFREALSWYLEAEKTGSNRNTPQYPLLLEKISTCYKNLNEVNEAILYLRRAADIYSCHDPSNRLATTLGNLALLYNEWGWDESALDCFRKAIQLQFASGDSIGAAFSLCNMADVYSRTVGHRKSIEYTKQALEIFSRKKDHGGMGYAFYKNAWAGKRFAMDYYRQSIAEHEKAGAPEQLSFTLGNVAEILLKDGNYKEAYPYLLRSANYADSARSDLAKSTSLTSLGKYYQMTGDIPKAINIINESQKIASRRGFKQLMAENWLILAESAKLTGNFREAYQYLQAYSIVHDSILSEKSRKIVAETEAKFSLEKKEMMIAKLTRENELKGQTILSKNRFSILILISSLVILLLLSLLTRFYYLKVRAHEQTVRIMVEQMKQGASPAPRSEKAESENGRVTGIQDTVQYPQAHEPSTMLIRKLRELVEAEKLFLEPELSMSEVADRLHTNTTYLSRAVNDILKKNFPAYINELRIKEAQRLLADHSFANRSIDGIALMSGFRSKSAFNTAFKKFTGMTPSFFQKSALRV